MAITRERLEDEIASVLAQKRFYLSNENLEKEVEQLKHDLAVRDRALEEVVMDVCYFRDNIAIKTTKKHYLKQAEEALKKLEVSDVKD